MAGRSWPDAAAPLRRGRCCGTWRWCWPTAATYLSDLAALRDQPGLFGPVASTPTAWRVVERVARDGLGLAGIRAARAPARARAWTAGADPGPGLLVVDVDGTLLDAHSDKQGAEGTYKGGVGFYPLLAFLDWGDGTGEALAGLRALPLRC